MTELLVFGVIAGGLLVLVVAQTWLQEMLKVRLREWLTYDLLDQWLAPKRAYMLSFAGPIGVNPDHRIHQDSQADSLGALAYLDLAGPVPLPHYWSCDCQRWGLECQHRGRIL